MIEIFLRQCYHSPNSEIANRKRPEWFSKKKCYENLLFTLDPETAKVNIIFDNFYGEPEEKEGKRIISAGNEGSSFLQTLEIVMSKGFPDDTIIYFLEDDYLHRPNWCEVFLEAFTLPVHYVTLYDHLDKYKYYPELASQIYVTPSAHWRTIPSTTNTYACRMSQLREDIDIHRKFSIGREISDDNGKFLELSRQGRILVSSLPGWSTHCDSYMSPVINWQNYLPR
jgi:hypothetical protein